MKTTTNQALRNRNDASLATHRIPWLEPLENRVLFSTYTVTTLGDGAGAVTPVGYGKFNAMTLRAAITAANVRVGADTINFASGITGAINLGSALPRIADTLILAGPGASKVTIQRSALAPTEFSIFRINARNTATISGLKIAEGTGTPVASEDLGDLGVIRYGGGIFNGGALTITRCTFSANSTLFNEFGWLGPGGGVYNSGRLTASYCTFSGNAGNSCIYNEDACSLTIQKSTISGNSGDIGGAIYNGTGVVALEDVVISGNSASYGAGIYNLTGRVRVTGCSIIGNSASPAGIYNRNGDVTIADTSISGNTGLGIDNSGMLAMTGCTISDNQGGGILNRREYYAGEYYNFGTASILGCTFSYNSNGGAIFNYENGTVDIRNSSFWRNSSNQGGALYNSYQSTMSVINSTLSGNSAVSGGAIFNQGGKLLVAQSTVSGNYSILDGGGIASSSNATLFNNVIAGNLRISGLSFIASDLSAGLVNPSSACNLIGVSRASGIVNASMGNRTGVTTAQLKLSPLANNGGPTQTMALRAGSIAIDAGSNVRAIFRDASPISTDQRGEPFARILGGRVDIGAYEFQPTG